MSVHPIRPPTVHEDPVEKALEGLKEAVEAKLKKERDRADEADSDAAEAIQALESYMDTARWTRSEARETVLETAVGLHEAHRGRGGASFAFCTERSCTAWQDLLRGWKVE